jgi:maltooligosyltrehalose trehalohydrolase
MKPLGAYTVEGGVRFAVWSTRARSAAVRLFAGKERPTGTHPLRPRGDGLFEAVLPGAGPGTLYKFVLNGDTALPDPYARALPYGVHGPAEVVGLLRPLAPFVPPSLDRCIIYELHVGAFTTEGTFRAAATKLPELARLGINAVEIMPVHSFPGKRGWGYDGVALYAPFAGYGTPHDLIAFVEQAHGLGIAVLLDVVFNHFGPSGNYLQAYSPEYFTSRHRTPWGDAPDFGNPYMRALVVNNARYWLEEYGFDGLRLDATHAIHDDSAKHVLQEIAEVARGCRSPKILVAEDDRNDPAVIRTMGMDAVWADDFHHQVRVLLTGERDGYYAAYTPDVQSLARVIERGWFYEGQIYPPTGKPRGKPAHLSPRHFVYCVQNHDQVGNRALGSRLHHEVAPDAYAAVSTLLLFLPATPLLFMGQEWAASSPFLYFSDHEPALGARISAGRKDEFKRFQAFADPAVRERIPDTQAPQTFARSKLAWDERELLPHSSVLELYQSLIALRRTDPVLSSSGTALQATADGDVLVVRRTLGGTSRTLAVNFGAAPATWRPEGRVLFSSGPVSEALPPRTAVLTGRDS